MCGITGVFGASSSFLLRETIQGMTDALVHRGPDESGIWMDEAGSVALGHRRLSILDLSSAGSQPMLSSCGRYVLVFNGEIYNHLQLKSDLENLSPCLTASDSKDKIACRWKGHSDTEVLLAALAQWGVEDTLHRLVGMFAFALWDRKKSQLYLARDRMGEKPLYYGWSNGAFLFASELKAFRQYPGFNNQIDRNALALYFRYTYVPAPYSIYQEIYKLEPGCLLELDSSGIKIPPGEALRAPANCQGISLSRWWSLRQVAVTGQTHPLTDEKHAVDQLELHLRESIRLQSVADVPLGAFLSGGVDSSLIVALMRTQNNIPVKTFTIGSSDKDYNEAIYARDIARHLGTDHTELYVTAKEARDVIPQLPQLYDEPFADSSQIPTYLVSKMARQQVTVALSGDGGDELFGGYNRYFWSEKIWRKISWMPYQVRNVLGRAVIELTPQRWNALYRMIAPLVPGSKRVDLFGDKIHKLADRLISVRDINDLYCSLISEWKSPNDLVIGGEEPATLISARNDWPSFSDHEHLMMYLDSKTYLPDDILCKVDTASMGSSLEVRVPFLDHRIIEMAWNLPLDMKVRNGQGKLILRELLYKFVPKEMIERPKQGFGVPIGEWLRGPLRDWAENLLDPDKMKQDGYLRPEPVRKLWMEHLNGKRNWEYRLWSVLMFNAWLRSQEQ